MSSGAVDVFVWECVSTMRGAAHPSGCARCGAGAGCSSIKYQSLGESSCLPADVVVLESVVDVCMSMFWMQDSCEVFHVEC